MEGRGVRRLRLEPADDPQTIEEGIEARVKDPLWMLGRQRQLGEFRARNSASVVRAELASRSQALTRVAPLEAEGGHEVDPSLPLEAQVEAEQPSTSSSPFWCTRRLTYGFQLESPTGARLVSRRYDGDRLDWFDVDLTAEGTWRDPWLANVRPTPARFPGAPHPRWWTMEDRRIDLGAIRRPDLNFLGVLAMEFSLLFGNDWYLLPLQRQVGRLHRLDRVTMVDSFGFAVDAQPAIDRSQGEGGFEVFTLTTDGAARPDGRVLFLPNVRHKGLRGEAIERVSVLRDEGANLVWAQEWRYRDASGQVIDRREEAAPASAPQPRYWDRDREQLVPREEVQGEGEPGRRFLGPVEQYVPQTYVPLHWIPYQPVRLDERGRLILRRSRTSLDVAGGPQYRTRIVAESRHVEERSVSVLGKRIERAEQVVRATDGRRHAWLGRQVAIDEHREPSGLRFDALRASST